MKKFKPVALLAAVLFFVTLLIPTVLVLPFGEDKASGKLGENIKQAQQTESVDTSASVEVAVFRAAKEQVEKIPLEDYIVGVVASEMPADFEKEALKAQALTARTYIVKQLMSDKKMELPQDAQVADTELYQVYKSPDELQKIWGGDYNWKIEKIREAVQETKGKVITYDGVPIDATFFSTGNGFTESSEAIWPNALPYLQSVESPWDKKSPKFTDQKVLSIKDFEAKLGVKIKNKQKIGEVTERTVGKRVAKVEINGKTVTGKEVREKLGLKSTDFTWEIQGNNVVITTKGYGHGVGMSQYGANGMAQEGKKYEEIVLHYYNGVEISNSDPFITTITAKK